MAHTTYRMVRRLAVSAVVLFAAGALPAVAGTQARHQDAGATDFARMHWKKGTLKLASSHGMFTVPRGGTMVVGGEATRADELINGSTDPTIEGYADFAHRSLYVSYVDEGFVNTDDWKDVNADDLMKHLRDATESANAERVKNGGPVMHIDGWVQRPTFDQARKSVRWVTHAHDESGRGFVNAVALLLGRHGYERFTLVSNGSDPKGDAVLLAAAANGYRFDPGFRFQDYFWGDKLAGYGIAALVGTAAGATIAKTVGFGAILLLIKKFFLVIVAALLGVFGYVKRFFAGRRTTGVAARAAQAPPPPAP